MHLLAKRFIFLEVMIGIFWKRESRPDDLCNATNVACYFASFVPAVTSLLYFSSFSNVEPRAGQRNGGEPGPCVHGACQRSVGPRLRHFRNRHRRAAQVAEEEAQAAPRRRPTCQDHHRRSRHPARREAQEVCVQLSAASPGALLAHRRRLDDRTDRRKLTSFGVVVTTVSTVVDQRIFSPQCYKLLRIKKSTIFQLTKYSHHFIILLFTVQFWLFTVLWTLLIYHLPLFFSKPFSYHDSSLQTTFWRVSGVIRCRLIWDEAESSLKRIQKNEMTITWPVNERDLTWK